jgi:hypothetical protein
MQLREFPRPDDDTGIGFHYYPDPQQLDRQDRRVWLDELGSLGASWLVVSAGLDQPVPAGFLRDLRAQRVEPIVRVVVRPIGPVDLGHLGELARDYAAAGVHYLYVYDEPNLATEWRLADWSAPNLVGRFCDLLFPTLEVIHDAGLCPLISPLAPGGHYWDLSFLDQLLDRWSADGRRYALDRLGLCVHHHASNRPLSWGAGGPERWPQVRPYHCPDGSEDQQGFRLFEWYDALVRRRLGRSLPLLSGETGLICGCQDDPDFPAVDAEAHADGNEALARLPGDGLLPDYLLNLGFYTLVTGERGPLDRAAWYKQDGTRLPAVGRLKGQERRRRRFSWDVPAAAPASSEALADALDPDHPIAHYLLVWPEALGEAPPRWEGAAVVRAAAPYVGRFQATLGFRCDEAKRSRRVTLVGPDAGALAPVERELRASGCAVEQVVVPTEADLVRALDAYLARGRRFAHLHEMPG